MSRSMRLTLAAVVIALAVPIGVAWGQTTSTSTTTSTATTTTTIASTTTTAISDPGLTTTTTVFVPPSILGLPDEPRLTTPFQCPPGGGTFEVGGRIFHCDAFPTTTTVAGPNVPSARVSFTG